MKTIHSYKIIIKLKEKHFPNKTIKCNKQKHKKTPWITRSIIKSINLKKQAIQVIESNSYKFTTLYYPQNKSSKLQ